MLVVERQLRDLMARGLTQSEIADRVKVTQPTISRLIRGVHADTGSAVAERIKELHDAVMSEAPPKLKHRGTAKPSQKAA